MILTVTSTFFNFGVQAPSGALVRSCDKDLDKSVTVVYSFFKKYNRKYISFNFVVSRVYSDFLHECKISDKMEGATAKFFHTAVTSVVGMYTHCLDQSTVRGCVYNETLRQTAETVSLFIIFIKGKALRNIAYTRKQQFISSNE